MLTGIDNMRIIDISMELSPDIVIWPEHDSFLHTQTSEISSFCSCFESKISMGIHTGTHIDAPKHFIQNGKPLQDLRLEKCLGPAFLIEILDSTVITAKDLALADIPPGTKRLLVKTKNSLPTNKNNKFLFDEDFVGFSVDAASWIICFGIELIGCDYLSVQPYHGSDEVHKILLEKECVILEGLNLELVSKGPYDLICLPLRIRDAEGSPVRAVLVG